MLRSKLFFHVHAKEISGFIGDVLVEGTRLKCAKPGVYPEYNIGCYLRFPGGMLGKSHHGNKHMGRFSVIISRGSSQSGLGHKYLP